MYAQTIAYGLLSARISRPAGLVAEDAALMVPRTNPFLRELMEEFLRIGGRQKDAPNCGIDFDELGVNDIVELLRKANMEAVITDFGRARPGEDPVIHFYEDFMKAYDAKQRVRRGIYYTPIPVVSFIVRSVDEILREEFGLPLGLADTTTWGEMKRRFDAGELPGAAASAASEDSAEADAELRAFTIPQGVSENDPFVQILDPAVGTGTFLVEVIDLIHKRMKEHWLAQGHMELELEKLWNEYVEAHLLPRLYGFELLMAPYAICHMKLGLKLADTGYRFRSSQRLRVYLTNSLEPPHDLSEMLEFVAPFLAHEARAANTIKGHVRATVVMGNPPYANYSSNLTDTARALVNKYRSYQGQPIRERNQLQFERNLQDDCVKFIAISEDQILLTGCGIVGLITNAVVLGSRSLRGVREHLAETFNDRCFLHLHGGTNERLGEPPLSNVFDIEQSVAIQIYSQLPKSSSGTNRIRHQTGSRASKYDYLTTATSREMDAVPFELDANVCSFLGPSNECNEILLQLDHEFSQYGAGIKTNRDGIAFGFTHEQVRRQVTESGLWTESPSQLNKSIIRILYRPFDIRYCCYHKSIVASRSWPTMSHMIDGDNLGIIASSSWTTPELFSVGVSQYPIEMKTGTHDRGSTLFPLERRVSGMRSHGAATSNVSARMSERLGGNDPLRALHIVYALLYSPTFRDRHRERLASAFPVVCVPAGEKLASALAVIGVDLVALHLLEDDYPHASWNQAGAKNKNPLALPMTTFHDAPGNDREVRKVGETSKKMAPSPEYGKGFGRVYINESAYFDGVPEEVWNFHIGGYQVCHKWLSDRNRKGGKNPRPGRVLTDEDIDHYQRIVIALDETIRIMAEIDKTIEAHGGWPNAFITDPEQLNAQTVDSQ